MDLFEIETVLKDGCSNVSMDSSDKHRIWFESKVVFSVLACNYLYRVECSEAIENDELEQ